MQAGSSTTNFRVYDVLDWHASDVVTSAKKECQALWVQSELLFPIGRVMGAYGDVRFRVERFGDGRLTWFLTDGVRFRRCSQKAVLEALKGVKQ